MDKYGDVIGWIEGLRSRRYLSDLIEQFHSKNITDRPEILARKVTPFVEAALNYIEQANNGPAQVAFLPLYYAMLNLAKIYVMLGPHRNELENIRRYRQHGIAYNTADNDELRLDRQRVTLRQYGVLGLFYRTLTGDNWVKSSKTITMMKVMQYITQVAAEYRMVTGRENKSVPVHFESNEEASDNWQLVCKITEKATSLGELPALKSGHWQAQQDGFASKHMTTYEGGCIELADCCIMRPLLYHGYLEYVQPIRQMLTVNAIPMSQGFPLMVEEFPIIVAFFYQGSIARYKPEFLYKQFDSKLWPLLVALRRHASYTFLLLFWHFMNQESVYLTST